MRIRIHIITLMGMRICNPLAFGIDADPVPSDHDIADPKPAS
jgi:hypothetical protein